MGDVASNDQLCDASPLLWQNVEILSLKQQGANNSLIKSLPSCTMTSGLVRSSKISLYNCNNRLFSSEMEMYHTSILYKTWISACSCCGVAVFKRNWR